MARGQAVNPYVAQALAEANARYGPQRDNLASLLAGARSDLHSGIAAQLAAARGMQDVANQTVPVIRNAFQAGRGAVGQTGQDISSVLSSLPQVASPALAAATAGIQRDSLRANTNLANELLQSANMIGGARARAQEGAAYNTRVLQSKYDKIAQDIMSKLYSLQGQQGGFVSSEAAKLQEAAAKNANDLAIAKIRSGGKGGGKGLTPNEANKITTQLDNTISLVKQFKKGGNGYNAIYDHLTQGIPKGALGPNSPTIKPVESAIVDAAWEIANSGRISPKTANELSTLNYSVPSQYAPAMVRSRRPPRRRQAAPVPLPGVLGGVVKTLQGAQGQ